MMRKMMASVALSALLMSGAARALDPQTQGQILQAQPSSTSSASSSSGGGGGLLGGIFGCGADGNKQELGAIIGGAAGAFLGNRIAGSGSRTLGTLLGGALGAAAGSAVGCKLQKNDRDKAQRATEQALATGQSQNWTNNETGASGNVSVAGAGAGAGLGDLRFADGVEPASGYVKVADSFTTTSSSNIRAAPNTTAAIRGKLPAGQRVWVPAQVKGQPWMLIAEDGVGQGYVSAPLLKKSTTVAASNCKMVTQSVSVPGEAEKAETYQACKGKDGAWTMTRV